MFWFLGESHKALLGIPRRPLLPGKSLLTLTFSWRFPAPFSHTHASADIDLALDPHIKALGTYGAWTTSKPDYIFIRNFHQVLTLYLISGDPDNTGESDVFHEKFGSFLLRGQIRSAWCFTSLPTPSISRSASELVTSLEKVEHASETSMWLKEIKEK